MPNLVQEMSEQKAESWEEIIGKYISLIFFLLSPGILYWALLGTAYQTDELDRSFTEHCVVGPIFSLNLFKPKAVTFVKPGT